MRYIFLILPILFISLLALQSDSSVSSSGTSVNSTILLLTEENIKDGLQMEYQMPNDLKMHISLSQPLFNKPTGIFLDSFEISGHFKKSTNGNMEFVSDFNIKPGKHSLIVDRKKIEFTAIYTFDSTAKNNDIKNTWQSRSKNFAKLIREGILLKNTDRNYGSFAFKRFYSDNLSVSIDLIPIHFEPGMVIYFGDNIYFMFNRDNVLIMKKGKNQHDTRIEKKETSTPFQDNKTYNLLIDRKSDTYIVSINGNKIAEYTDVKELKNQRFRNIGITMPKNGCEILIKKIVIK